MSGSRSAHCAPLRNSIELGDVRMTIALGAEGLQRRRLGDQQLRARTPTRRRHGRRGQIIGIERGRTATGQRGAARKGKQGKNADKG